MDSSQLSWITTYIWGIADDVLRDLYVRGKYRDVILPMTVLRRLVQQIAAEFELRNTILRAHPTLLSIWFHVVEPRCDSVRPASCP